MLCADAEGQLDRDAGFPAMFDGDGTFPRGESVFFHAQQKNARDRGREPEGAVRSCSLHGHIRLRRLQTDDRAADGTAGRIADYAENRQRQQKKNHPALPIARAFASHPSLAGSPEELCRALIFRPISASGPGLPAKTETRVTRGRGLRASFLRGTNPDSAGSRQAGLARPENRDPRWRNSPVELVSQRQDIDGYKARRVVYPADLAGINT